MKDRRALSVAAAARELKMHRATLHRYLQRNPGLIRNARGKVVMWRLIEQIKQAKQDEARGRRLAIQPRKIVVAKAPKLARGLARSLREYSAWRKELGNSWLEWDAQECREMSKVLRGIWQDALRLHAELEAKQEAKRLMPLRLGAVRLPKSAA